MHHAEAPINIQLRGCIPIYFGVSGPAIEEVGPRGVIVVHKTGDGKVREGNETEDLLRNRVDTGRGNNLSRNFCLAAAVRVTGEWIKDAARGSREVTVAHGLRRDRNSAVRQAPVESPLIVAEEEKLVLLYRATQGPAELVVHQFRLALVGRQEETAGPESVVRMIFKSRTMKVVRAALDLHIDCAPAGQTLLGIETVGDNIHRLDGFHRWHVSGNVRKPNVVAAGAINTYVVGAGAGSVHIVPKGPRRVRGHRVLVGRH